MVDRIHPSSSAPTANISAVTGPTDLPVDAYSWELLGDFALLDTLARAGINESYPWAQMLEQQLMTAANGPGSAVDPQVYQLLQSFKAAGGTFSSSWWAAQAGPSAANPDGFVYDWMKAHSDINSGTDEVGTAFATIMCMLDTAQWGATGQADAEAFFNFSTGGTRIDPAISSLLPYLEPLFFEYLWQQFGSPQSPSDPTWASFASNLGMMMTFFNKISPELGPAGQQFVQDFQNDINAMQANGGLPPDFTPAALAQDLTEFSQLFSAYLNSLQ